MARVIQYNSDMLRDGFSHSTASIYGYLRWCTCKTRMLGDVKPSIGLICKTLFINRRTVIRGIKELEKAGLIEVVRGYKEKNIYFIYDLSKYPAISGKLDEDKLMESFNREKFKRMKRWGHFVIN